MKLAVLPIVSGFVLSLYAQHSTTAITNPFNTAEDRIAGQKIFLSQCANCHGRDGKGAAGVPDLTTGSYRRASSDEGLYQIVLKGVPGSAMPGFKMDGADAWRVVAYIRSLSPLHQSKPIRGNAVEGEKLFQSLNCAGCHALTEGQRATGPDLRVAVTRRSPDELRKSILDPNASVDSEYWTISGTADSGETLAGVRLNEDAFTIQLREANGRLRTVERSTLRNVQVNKQSPMPIFAGKLTEDQLEDVLAYLSGLVQRGGLR